MWSFPSGNCVDLRGRLGLRPDRTRRLRAAAQFVANKGPSMQQSMPRGGRFTKQERALDRLTRAQIAAVAHGLSG